MNSVTRYELEMFIRQARQVQNAIQELHGFACDLEDKIPEFDNPEYEECPSCGTPPLRYTVDDASYPIGDAIARVRKYLSDNFHA